MKSAIRFAVALAAALAVAGPAAAGVEDVKTPRGEMVRLLVEKPDNPSVTVVLFAGGAGVLDISESGDIGRLSGNFLVRSRNLFQGAGAITAVIDSPSDQRFDMYNFRTTTKHAQDVGAVIKHLKREHKLPVWLVGTSRGTESVANAAVRLTENKPAGIVLTSSLMKQHPKHGSHVLAMDVDKITIPVLIAHHERDACEWTPPEKVPDVKAALKNAKPVKVLTYDGGEGVRGDPCRARHYHGFAGIEDKVVGDIMAWIKNPAP